MASIFTIQGTALPKRVRKHARKRAARAECTLGECKTYYNPRTKRRVKSCCVGKVKSKTGWKFTKA